MFENGNITYKTSYIHNGIEFYIDHRWVSPYGYKYDWWWENLIVGRVTDKKMVDILTINYERRLKLKKICGKLEM